jgi:hypothetical protein
MAAKVVLVNLHDGFEVYADILIRLKLQYL